MFIYSIAVLFEIKREGKKEEEGEKNEKEKEKWNIARNVLEIELRDAEHERIQATDRLNFSFRYKISSPL